MPRRLGYAPALDGVRGIAILVVVCGHVFRWPNPHLGVEIFFVLSGFLITVLLLQEWAATGRISLRAFYWRRALRLVPALLVALAGFLALSLGLVLAGADVPPMSEAAAAAAYSVLYVANFVQAFDHQLVPGLRHTWSLAIEEQFYVVWPLVLLVALRARARWRTIALLLCAALAFVVARRLQLHLAGVPSARTGFAPDTRADSLIVGCLFGIAFHAGAGSLLRSATLRRWASLLGGLVAVWLLFLSPAMETFIRGLWPVFSVGVACVVLRGAADPDSRTARGLSARPLIYLGRISYGLYLWHLILLWTPPFSPYFPDLARVGVAVVAAVLSYRYVETPFLRRKRAVRDAVGRPAGDAGRGSQGPVAIPVAPAVAVGPRP